MCFQLQIIVITLHSVSQVAKIFQQSIAEEILPEIVRGQNCTKLINHLQACKENISNYKNTNEMNEPIGTWEVPAKINCNPVQYNLIQN